MRNRWFQLIQNNLEDHIEKIGDNPIEEMLEKTSVSEAIMRLNANEQTNLSYCTIIKSVCQEKLRK